MGVGGLNGERGVEGKWRRCKPFVGWCWERREGGIVVVVLGIEVRKGRGVLIRVGIEVVRWGLRDRSEQDTRKTLRSRAGEGHEEGIV